LDSVRALAFALRLTIFRGGKRDAGRRRPAGGSRAESAAAGAAEPAAVWTAGGAGRQSGAGKERFNRGEDRAAQAGAGGRDRAAKSARRVGWCAEDERGAWGETQRV